MCICVIFQKWSICMFPNLSQAYLTIYWIIELGALYLMDSAYIAFLLRLYLSRYDALALVHTSYYDFLWGYSSSSFSVDTFPLFK